MTTSSTESAELLTQASEIMDSILTTIIVKLLSTAGTGFFYTTRRPRTTAKLSFMKFDPRANQNVLFNEAKINRPN
ncbi:hypothetical protein BG003_005967 [Podila horticola]|nr:hypothetical protein BG003_005967 [Podila horticola]